MLEFYRGLKSKYPVGSVVEGHELWDVIYFATDTHEILVNNESFGLDDQRVKSVRAEDGQLVFTVYQPSAEDANENFETEMTVGIGLDESTQKAIETLKGLIGEDGNLSISLQYQSAMDDSYKTVDKIGGIEVGTTAADLKKKTLSQVLDDLIFPTVQPTKVDNNVSISRKTGVDEIKEVGATSWTADNFTVTASVGEIRISGKKKQDYAGAASNLTVNGVPVTMTYGAKSISGSATFAAGPTPLDSKGGTAKAFPAYAGGTKTSTATTVYVVYPFYANANDITKFNKLTLVKSNVNNFTVKFVPEKGVNTHTFKLPTSRAITTIEMLNTLSNQYETIAMSNFIQSKETIDVNGTNVEYTVYKRNQGENGDATFKITYKNS